MCTCFSREVTRCDRSNVHVASEFRLAIALSTYLTRYCQLTPRVFGVSLQFRNHALPSPNNSCLPSQGASGSTAHIESKPALGPPAVSGNYPAPQQCDSWESRRRTTTLSPLLPAVASHTVSTTPVDLTSFTRIVSQNRSLVWESDE